MFEFWKLIPLGRERERETEGEDEMYMEQDRGILHYPGKLKRNVVNQRVEIDIVT